MKRIASTLGIAAAAASCGCNGGGKDAGPTVVDPCPPPLKCSDFTGTQDLLTTDPQLRPAAGGFTVSFEVYVSNPEPNDYDGPTFIENVAISDLTGDLQGAAPSIDVPETSAVQKIAITIPLAKEDASGTFKVKATAKRYGCSPSSCPVERTFSLEARGGTVTLTERETMPLRQRHAARIRVIERTEDAIALEARTRFAGPCSFGWATTGGCLETVDATRVLWRLPREPGLHQAQLIADFGEQGLAFDTLTVEVG